MKPRLLGATLAAAALPALAWAAATLGGPLPTPLPLFPSDNWWNVDVSTAPLDTGSAGFIMSIGSTKTMHPDFGGTAGAVDIYGFPYVVVDAGQARKTVTFQYSGESDGVDHATNQSFPFYPIPDEAITQAHWIEGGPAGNANVGGDRHMLIVDKDNKHLYELFALRWTAGHWEAGSGASFDLTKNDRRPDTWTSADASGLAILPGLVRHDEVYGAGEIRHAFRVTVHATNGHAFPASHDAGGTPGAPPLGTRLRLKAGKDISGFPEPMQKIFRAMKTYGLIVTDNGSDMYVSGTFDTGWDNDVLNPAFHSLVAADFEVVKLGWTPPGNPVGPKISISDASVTEGQAGSVSAVFTVSLSAPSPVPVGVTYATAPVTASAADIMPASGTLVFPPGTTALPLSVTVLGDLVNEGDETFVVNLTNSTQGVLSDPQGVGTILDDDAPPTLSVAGTRVTEGDAGYAIALVTVSLSAPAGHPVRVGYVTANGTARAGRDYLAQSGTVVLPEGVMEAEVALAVVGDLVAEPDESFTVSLRAPEGAGIDSGVATVTIVDNDTLPGLAVGDAWVVEGHVGTRNAVFRVSLSAPSATDVSVDWATADGTALAGEDYQPSGGTLVIRKGARAGTLLVPVVGDRADERNEAFLVRLSNPVGARIYDGLAQGVIRDDDGTPDAYTPIASLPYAATRAGKYRLAGDLQTAIPEGAAVTVLASGVTIDLDGHTLGGTAGPSTEAFGILSRNRANVTVLNGAVQGFFAGVFLAGAPPYAVPQRLTASSLHALGNTYAGLWLEGRGNVVSACEVVGTGGSTALGPDAGAVGIASVGPVPRLLGNQVRNTLPSGEGSAFGIAANGATKGVVSGNLVKNAAPAGSTGILVTAALRTSVVMNGLDTLDYGVVFASSATGYCSGNTATAVATPYMGVACQP